uniref:PAS domain-containing protein n=1 Tax=Zonotrichia albicollis TaxID=44394 RepID=A0A8D2MDK3_ZONAL
ERIFRERCLRQRKWPQAVPGQIYFVALKNPGAKEAQRDGACGAGPALGSAAVPEGELLLQALNGFVLVVTSEGLIFYSSHTIQDYLGFHQTDVMHQSVFELIHTEDQPEFRRNLRWALDAGEPSAAGKSLSSSAGICKPDQLPPENSSFLERSFVCRFRCLLDNSSGFLVSTDPPQQERDRLTTEGHTSIETTLWKDPVLLSAMLSWFGKTGSEPSLTPCGSGGQRAVVAALVLPPAVMQTGESGLTVFRLLTKDKRWKWVQANARLVYRNGNPEYIVVTQRPLVDEEGGEHLRKRSMHLPFTFATGEALLYQSSHPLPGFPDLFQSKGKLSKSKKPPCSHAGRSQRNGIDPRSLLGAVMQQDKAVYTSHSAPIPNPSFSSTFQLKGVSLPGAGGDAWGMGTAPASSRGNSLQEKLLDLQQEDPLLATMDLLSIKSDQSCSNELFSALEGLGLNAEDLGLLLLDEKMVMVRTDPDQSPSLNNSLASNQILSHVPRPPADGHEGGQQVCPLPGTWLCPAPPARSVRHLHAPAAAVHPADPNQEHDLQDQAQAGLHPLGVRCQVRCRAFSAPFLTSPPALPVSSLCSLCLTGGRSCWATPRRSCGCVARATSLSTLLTCCTALRTTSGVRVPSLLPCDCVCPLLRAPAQPGVPGLSRDGISQPQDCPGPGPGLPPQQFHLDGLCSLDAAGPGDSWQEMAPYPRIFPPFYQLVPEKQLSSVLSVPQHSSPSSAAGHFGSISSPLETLNSYGTWSQEGRHRPHSGSGLPSSAMALPQDHPVLGGSLALPCQPQRRAEVLPDPPHASRTDFYL